MKCLICFGECKKVRERWVCTSCKKGWDEIDASGRRNVQRSKEVFISQTLKAWREHFKNMLDGADFDTDISDWWEIKLREAVDLGWESYE